MCEGRAAKRLDGYIDVDTCWVPLTGERASLLLA
jgi:hypothetical protein